MPFRHCLSLLVLGLALVLVAFGCRRAQRYPAVSDLPTEEGMAAKDRVKLFYGWMPTETANDIPIVFVDAESQPEEWQKLPEFWNHFPGPALGMRTIHFGQEPWSAVLGMVAADRMEEIRIKVPFGLPDPTPYIPESNPPTYAKWVLGRELFFDRHWLTEGEAISCATCHDPKQGFSYRDSPLPRPPVMNPPSLINSVYNQHQFWDGRVTHLEQVVQRQLEDEFKQPESGRKTYHAEHSWSGIVPRLSRNQKYRDRFELVFGIAQPTTDTAAKALATYMRTILSGNSLYDQARKAADKENSDNVLARHFQPLLKSQVLESLERHLQKPEEVADELASGYKLFFSKGCHQCHSGWNFTNNSFHNIGIRESADPQIPGHESGHFRHQPYGLKDRRMLGAFKTPTLRNLPQTQPYFHDASAQTLEQVIEYYNDKIEGLINKHLDPELKGTSLLNTRSLRLTKSDVRALALFLRSLDGEPVPPVVAAPPK